MLRRLELLLETRDDTLLLRAPTVGVFTDCLPKDDLVAPGTSAGTILTLGRAFELVVPPGVTGRIVSERPERVHHPAGYGDVLYELAPLSSGDAPNVAAAKDEATTESGPLFRAPHSGRFWSRPAPTDPPFVEQGQTIEVGTTIGLVEVMKTFTHLAYESRGTTLPERARVVRLLIADGDEVESGDALLEVEPA